VLAALVAIASLVASPVVASPAEEYTGTHFGERNMPAGCERESFTSKKNACYHMRTGLNGLDSPQVDVLVMVPGSATAERDMRIMRQAVEMWEAGVHNLAPQMRLPWLAQGMQFHITVDIVDTSGTGGEFTTYPIVDPEIVVIATNPVGAVGIGIDPVATVGTAFGRPGDVPCAGLRNPFDFDAWQALPGFDRHHEARAGTYVEDCGGAGGNICFAVNTARDAAPESFDGFNLFDLVSHEFGHCLTLGHVGDGAEGDWSKVPTNDIMAYSDDPEGRNKCVSTLDVEVIATRMSGYLDVNDDRKVDDADQLLTNDQTGDGIGNPFQTQHPRDHLYASSTGDPTDCPQPDLGFLPGRRTDWEPDPVSTKQPVLTVTEPTDGAASATGAFHVAGTVAHLLKTRPTKSAEHYDDADNDAQSPATEITSLDVDVKPATVEATVHVEQLPTSATNTVAYSASINGRRFDSFVRSPLGGEPSTWDTAGDEYLPRGTSTWDAAASKVTFHIPRDYLKAASIEAPYKVSGRTSTGTAGTRLPDDYAPDDHRSVGVTHARTSSSSLLSLSTPVVSSDAASETTTFEHPSGNAFKPRNTTLGLGPIPLRGTDHSHHYAFEVPATSDVSLTLDWTGTTGLTDLDLFTYGAANSSFEGALGNKPEVVTLTDVRGELEIVVDPFLVADPEVTYTLIAVVTPKPIDDADGDAVPDKTDVCPTIYGEGADGCPIKPTEAVVLYVDGTKSATQAVDTTNDSDAFDIPLQVSRGNHTLRLDWEAFGRVLASKSLKVSRR